MANKAIPRIEGILQFYSIALGNDYNAYRNHVYRVYHLALLLNPSDLTIEENESLAIAVSFHDLGVWTHNTMDYISPSIDLANSYMSENGMQKNHLVSMIIGDHHKVLKSTSKNSLVETMRQADLIDLSFGIIRFGLPKNFYKTLCEDFPFLEFQKKIVWKLLSYATLHPLKPFPMMKM